MMTDPNLHLYDVRGLWPDYLRAALGGGVCGAPLLFVAPGSVMFCILLGLTLLFLGFGVETLGRQALEVRRDPNGLAWTGLLSRLGLRAEQKLIWDELRELKLRFFSPGRDGKDGWMQLSLDSTRSSLKVHSSISGFDGLLRASLAAANARNLPLSSTTRANLKALGMIHEAETPAERGIA